MSTARSPALSSRSTSFDIGRSNGRKPMPMRPPAWRLSGGPARSSRFPIVARNPLLIQAIALSGAGRNAEAVALLREVASTGDPEALGVLAEATWRGGLVQQDPVDARRLYEQAAEKGHANASLIITNLLASGVAGKQDWGA